MQDKSVNSKNRLQFSFQEFTHVDLISGVFDNLYRENEEFLVAFDLCRDDLQNQVQSILFQYDKLNKLYRKIDELCRYDVKSFLQHLAQSNQKPTTPTGINNDMKNEGNIATTMTQPMNQNANAND